MKLVIEIDEDVYKDIKRGKIYTSVRDVPQESVVAIANGTPLPKGHGRLIDADALNRKDVNCANVPMNFIDTAQTIIEAESEDKK